MPETEVNNINIGTNNPEVAMIYAAMELARSHYGLKNSPQLMADGFKLIYEAIKSAVEGT